MMIGSSESDEMTGWTCFLRNTRLNGTINSSSWVAIRGDRFDKRAEIRWEATEGVEKAVMRSFLVDLEVLEYLNERSEWLFSSVENDLLLVAGVELHLSEFSRTKLERC